ncbi:hypothetical protein [Streptomyces sp. NPDC001985]
MTARRRLRAFADAGGCGLLPVVLVVLGIVLWLAFTLGPHL